MMFAYGGKDHLHVECTSELWKLVRRVMQRAVELKVDANDVFLEALDGFADFEALKGSGDGETET